MSRVKSALCRVGVAISDAVVALVAVVVGVATACLRALLP